MKATPKDSIQAVVDRCILTAKEFSEAPMFGKPTDIIGFSEVGQELASRLEKIVGTKEICYYDTHPTNSKYHYLDFKDMLERTEYMFITCPATPKYLALFNDLSNLNINCKIIIAANGFEEVAKRLTRIVGKEKVRLLTCDAHNAGTFSK